MRESDDVVALVIYAKEEEVAHGGKIDFVHRLSSLDRYAFPEQPILFLYNTDAECKKQNSIESDEPAFVMYVEKDAQPFTLIGDKDDISFDNVYNWI